MQLWEIIQKDPGTLYLVSLNGHILQSCYHNQDIDIDTIHWHHPDFPSLVCTDT